MHDYYACKGCLRSVLKILKSKRNTKSMYVTIIESKQLVFQQNNCCVILSQKKLM